MSASFSSGGSYSSGDWTFEEQKVFELALATNFNRPDRWECIAACLPSRSADEVQAFYTALEDDMRKIEAGQVALPPYGGLEMAPPPPQLCDSARRAEAQGKPSPKKAKIEAPALNHNMGTLTANPADKRKGVPWTEEEHRLFLLGLAKFGKGDWRSIARNFVVSRTPTQVASHAQKYFIRLNNANKKDKRRASIHDITSATLPELQGVMPGSARPQRVC